MKIVYDLTKIKGRLLEKSKSQSDLAGDGLSASVISKFFRGKAVRPKTAAAIVAKLQLKLWGAGGVATLVKDETEIKRKKTA